MDKKDRIDKINDTLLGLRNNRFRYDIDSLIKVFEDEFRMEGGFDSDNKNYYWSNLREIIEETHRQYTRNIGKRRENESLDYLLKEAENVLDSGLRWLS